MASAGTLTVEVGVNLGRFESGMRRVDDRLNRLGALNSRVERSFGALGRGVDRVGSSLARVTRGASSAILTFFGLRGAVLAASGGFLGGAGLVYAMQKAVMTAISLEEQTNKVGVVFGRSSAAITRWSRTTATGIGIAQTAALEAVGTFGNMLRPLGILPQRAASMSRSLVNLAGDMSSFNNASIAETLDAIRAGLAGETEPLRRFGVFLSDVRLKAEAIRSGFVTRGFKGVLDPVVRTMSAYNLILRDTKLAQGDYNRTANSTANVIRTVKAQVTDLSGAFGKGLEPVVNRVGIALRDKLGASSTRQAVAKLGRLVGDKLEQGLRRIGQWFQQHWGGIKEGFRLAGDFLVVAAQAAERLAAALKAVNENTPGGLGTLLAGYAGFRVAGALRGRKGGGNGALATAVAAGAAVPTPVKIAGVLTQVPGASGARNYSAGTYPALAELLGNDVLFRRYAPILQAMADGPTISQSSPQALRRMEQFARKLGLGKSTVGGFDREERRAAVQRGERKRKAQARADAATGRFRPVTASTPLQTSGQGDSAADAAVRAKRADDRKRAAVERVRMSTLFSGPFLTGDAFATAASFGYKAKPRDLLRDLRMQNAQLTTLSRSVNTLRRRGAPKALIGDLLAGGIDNADEAAALAGMGRGTFKQYVKAFANRERLEERIQSVAIKSQTVNVTASTVNVGNARHHGSGSGDKHQRVSTRVGARRAGR